MRRVRVIPTLLIENRKLVKTICFKSPAYVGDPINALRIFNEKEVDEISVLDISATKNGKGPDIDFIRKLTSECFMPLSYGGGVSTVAQAKEIYHAGVEKVVIGTAAHANPNLIKEISRLAGTQSVVVSLDVKKDWLRRNKVTVKGGTENIGLSPVEFAKKMVSLGAGEILFQNIDREGTLSGYDLALIKDVVQVVQVPVIASGGAASIDDFLLAIQAGASAVAAGAMFVYKGPHKAVLISYPDQETLKENLYLKLQ